MELIGEYLGQDLSLLPNYETYLSEGDRGEVRFYVDRQVSEEKIQELQDSLLSEGVTLTEPISQIARVLLIKFEKRLAPLAIIAIVVGGIIAAGAGLLGWQIWKTTQMGIPIWVWVVAGGALLYLIFTSKPAKEVGGLAIQAGKVYVTKKALSNPRRIR